MRASIAVVAFALTSLGFMGAQQVNLRPGLYEVTTEVSMGRGMAPITQKSTDCVAAEDVKDFTKAMLREMGNEAANCKIADLKSTGDKLTFTLNCKSGADQMSSANEITFTGDSFTTLTSTTMKGNAISSKQSGKRIGDCK